MMSAALEHPIRDAAFYERVAALPMQDRPLAAEGLHPYRAKGAFGWLMIGATSPADALAQGQSSSTRSYLTMSDIQSFDWTDWTYKPIDETPEQERRRVWGACGGKCGEAGCIEWNERNKRRQRKLAEEERHLDQLADSIETEPATVISAEMKEGGYNVTEIAGRMRAAALSGVKQFKRGSNSK